MSETTILFIISVLPVILIGLYIYKKDKEREPFKLLLKLFFGGIGSCFLVLIVSGVLGSLFPLLGADSDNLGFFELVINVFIGVALVEEFCKWIVAYRISFNDDSFDELYDAILYCTFVALGFACFENILYVFDGGIGTGIARALLAVPGHACDGVFMGYYLGLAKVAATNGHHDIKRRNLLLSIIVPTVMHGIYDFCLSVGDWTYIIIFFIFVICTYIFVIKRIKKVSSIDRKIKYKK